VRIKNNFPENFAFISLKVKPREFNYTWINLLRPITRPARLSKEQLEIEFGHKKYFRHIIESNWKYKLVRFVSLKIASAVVNGS